MDLKKSIEHNIKNYAKIDFYSTYDSNLMSIIPEAEIAFNFIRLYLINKKSKYDTYMKHIEEIINMPYIYRLRIFNQIFCEYLREFDIFLKVSEGNKLLYNVYVEYYNSLPSEYKLTKSFIEYNVDQLKLYNQGIINLMDFCIKVDIPLDLFLQPGIIIDKWPLRINTGGTLCDEMFNTYNKYIISKVRQKIHKINEEPEFKIDSLPSDLQDVVVQYSLGGDFSRQRPNPYRPKITLDKPDMGFGRAGNNKRRSKSPRNSKKKSPRNSKKKSK